jgi:hypothetical protein
MGEDMQDKNNTVGCTPMVCHTGRGVASTVARHQLQPKSRAGTRGRLTHHVIGRWGYTGYRTRVPKLFEPLLNARSPVSHTTLAACSQRRPQAQPPG